MEIKRKYLTLGTLGIILIWGASAVLIYKNIPKDERGSFGDMFGSVNALFSGLALFGIIISILIQQNELKEQRNELKLTRDEFKINRVTNILFKQIEMLNRIIDSTHFSSGEFDIIEFIIQLNDLDEANKRSIYNQNSGEITGLITKIVSLMENFENVLNESKVDNSDNIQMKSLFYKNINPHFISLILHEIEDIKKESNNFHEDKFKKIYETVHNVRTERVKYIYEFDKTK